MQFNWIHTFLTWKISGRIQILFDSLQVCEEIQTKIVDEKLLVFGQSLLSFHLIEEFLGRCSTLLDLGLLFLSFGNLVLGKKINF